MSQEPKQSLGPPPIGVVYNTSMARPDAALALAALYVSASRRDSRMGAVCVTGALAWLSWRKFERGIVRWGRSTPYETPAATTFAQGVESV